MAHPLESFFRPRCTAVLGAANARFPGATYLGFAFWLVWQRVMWGVAAAAVPAGASGVRAASPLIMHLAVNLALVACTILCAARERRLPRTPRSQGHLLLAGALLASLGSIVALAALAGALPFALFPIGSVAAGLGMGILLLHAMALFGALAPGRVLLMSATAWCFAAASNIVLGVLPFGALAAAFSLLPFASAALFALGLFPAPLAAASAPEVVGHTTAPQPRPAPPRSFWAFAFTVFVVSLAAQSVAYFNGSYYGPEVRQLSSAYVDVAMVAVASLLIVYAALFPRSYNYNVIYYPAVFVVMGLLALLFVSPVGSLAPLVVARVAFQLFGLILWCLLSYIAGQSKSSPIQVYAFGYGLHMLGSVLGYVLGWLLDRVLVHTGADLLFGYLVVAILVMGVSIAVYPPRAMRDLLAAVPEDDAEPVGTPPTTGDRWTQACDEVAADGGLTDRERDVMRLLVRGRGGAHIAEALNVSLSTAYTHTRNIYRKLDAHSREDLMALVDARLEADATQPSP